ncbi:MAG: hypothetical protein JXJ17_10080 [Anaerolineae bacterium]|nr:hypothetical protein [Anaerolineae bacterium]
MSTEQNEQKNQSGDQQDAQALFIGIGIGIVVITIIVVVGGVLLAVFADQTSAAVEVIRDFLIIVMALELVIIATAITVFLIQTARFINLLNNEIQPIITSTQDTVNTVRGTAAFLSKNLTEPVMKASSTMQAIGKTMKDIDAIRKVTEIAFSAASMPVSEENTEEPLAQHKEPTAVTGESIEKGSIDSINNGQIDSKGD